MVHYHNTGNQFAVEANVTRPESRERRNHFDRRSEARSYSIDRRVKARSSESQTFNRGFNQGVHRGFMDGTCFGIVLGAVGVALIAYVTRFIS